MRGRTNITQRSGTVPVNGDIIEAEVSGTDISAGDFVKYKTIESSKELMNASSAYEFKDYVKFGEDYYICLIYTSLYLFKISGDDINIVATYNDYLVNCFTLLDDNSIACSIQSDPYVVRIAIVDENFVLLNSATNGVPLTTEFCFYYQNFLCFVKKYNDGDLSIYYYKVNELYEIEYVNYINKNMAGYGSAVYACIFENGNLYFLKPVASSSSSNKYSYIYNVGVSFEENKIILETIFSLKTNYYSLVGSLPNIFHNKYYVIVSNLKEYSNTTSGYRAFLVVNIISGSYEIIKLSSLGLLSGSDNNFGVIVASKIIDNSKFILYTKSTRTGFDSNISIINVSKESGSLSVISNIFSTTVIPSMAFIFFDNFIIRFITILTPSYKIVCYNYEVNNTLELITDKEDKNVVTSWDEGSLAIGFAKTSGTSGETIQVYVPKSN